MKAVGRAGIVAATLVLTGPAFAQPDEPKPAPPPAGAPPVDPTEPSAPAPPAAQPPADKPADQAPAPPTAPGSKPLRQLGEELTPKATEAPPHHNVRFTADPVGDTGIILLGLTFGILSSEILSTGEIQPQQISPTFKTTNLLGIDRGAITQKLDSNANQLSNFGLYASIAYVAGDTIADIFREGKIAALVDFIMYAEAATITQGVTNLAKIAFRRPRPIAYIERNDYIAKGGDPNTYDNSDTDSALSFFSAHSSQVAAMSAAATYIAFSRSPKGVRPWITLGVGAALTSFVAYERVRSGNHFPTDVMAGALAGAAVGGLVVHLHREDSVKQRPVWIGLTPVVDGGVLGASGRF
ncbi:MAG: phosphatase PAP2 family protein [Labilithrix sp.]